MNTLLPDDSAERKGYPIYSGLLQYFPSALAAIAHHSFKGNEKHNPGQPLHHDRAKSGDEADALVRHLMEGDYVGMAWRALALLQKHLESQGAPVAPGARNAVTPTWHVEGTTPDFTVAFDPPDWASGVPVENSYLASFGPNDMQGEQLREYGIGDVPSRHPMSAAALQAEDERLAANTKVRESRL